MTEQELNNCFSSPDNNNSNNNTEIDCEIIQINENNCTQAESNKRVRGRPKSIVWEHFYENGSKFHGHIGSICKYCEGTKESGRPSAMIAHLALQCIQVPALVRQKFLQIIASSDDGVNKQSKTKKNN
jgi:hypothetical protein